MILISLIHSQKQLELRLKLGKKALTEGVQKLTKPL